MKRFEKGYLLLGSIHRIAIRLHWTAPLGAVVFGGFKFVPAFWGAFLLLVLIHELGHAAIVRLSHARVTMIDLDGAGGLCHWRGDVTPVRRALIAWGGIFGQLAALLAACSLLWVFGQPENEYLAQAADAFTRANLWMGAFNLIPVRYLDGAKAWQIVPLLYQVAKSRAVRQSKKKSAHRAAKKELAELDRSARGEDAVSTDVENALARLASEVNRTAKK